jgi:hypothetical protein
VAGSGWSASVPRGSGARGGPCGGGASPKLGVAPPSRKGDRHEGGVSVPRGGHEPSASPRSASGAGSRTTAAPRPVGGAAPPPRVCGASRTGIGATNGDPRNTGIGACGPRGGCTGSGAASLAVPGADPVAEAPDGAEPGSCPSAIRGDAAPRSPRTRTGTAGWSGRVMVGGAGAHELRLPRKLRRTSPARPHVSRLRVCPRGPTVQAAAVRAYGGRSPPARSTRFHGSCRSCTAPPGRSPPAIPARTRRPRAAP